MLVNSINQKICISICTFMSIFLVYFVSVTRSLVITGLAWLSVFSLFTSISAISAFVYKSNNSTNKRYTFGKVRFPVLAVFSTTVLAQLSAIFLAKEAIEHFFHHGQHHGQHHHSHHGGDAGLADDTHSQEAINKLDYYFYLAAFASSTSLLTVAYAIANQPFNYVLKHASSSVIQEHASDISHALCYFIPGLAQILLPRINSLSLLAVISTLCAIFVQWFRTEFPWIDSACALILSFVVFSSMMPLSTFTGRILLQTNPPHMQNQLDKLISEVSTVDGVLELINTHFWQLDFNTIVGTVDVRVRRDADEQKVLRIVYNKLSSLVGICAVQVLKDPTSTLAHHNQQQRYLSVSHYRHAQQSPSPDEYHNCDKSHNDDSCAKEHGHSHSPGHSHSTHHHH